MLSEMKITLTDGKITMMSMTACQSCGKEILRETDGDRKCFICGQNFCFDCVRAHEYDCGKFKTSRYTVC